MGVGGTSTYPSNKMVRDAIKICPMDRILLETDAPYLAPVPHRGKINAPNLVVHTYNYVAEILKTTDKGIHKDDFKIMINDKEAEEFASQGQKRTILLALKVGIVKLIERIIKDEPILLLDDVFSELDENRRKLLLELLPKNIQIFISTTDMIQNNYNREIKTFVIDGGNVIKEAK